MFDANIIGSTPIRQNDSFYLMHLPAWHGMFTFIPFPTLFASGIA